jgi:DNA-binding beta-propeller fold protein YncE
VVTVLLAPATGSGLAERSTLPRSWVVRYDGPEHRNDGARDLAISPDGRTVYVAGTIGSGGWRSRWVTMAIATGSGAVRWVAPFAASEEDGDAPEAIAVSPDGRSVYVTGSTLLPPYVPGSSYMVLTTVAYDAATGNRRWVTIHDRGPFIGSRGNDVAVSADGERVYVVGGCHGERDQGFLLAYRSETGRARWQTVGATGGPIFALALGPDGRSLFTAGVTGGVRTDAVTAAVRTSDGSIRWSRRYDGGVGLADVARDVAVAPDGRTVVVTGGATVVGGTTEMRRTDMVTIAYRSSDGRRRWVSFPDPWIGDAGAGRLGIDPSGTTVVATGLRNDDGIPTTWVTVAFDLKSGGRIWQVDRPHAVGGRDPVLGAWREPLDLGVGDDLALVTGGIRRPDLGPDLRVDGYAIPDGSTIVRATYDGPAGGSDVGRAVTLASDGDTLVVAGDSAGPNRRDLVVVAFRR